MAGISASGSDLELGEHPRFEKIWQGLQTLIFSLFGLLVVAGLAGLFGSGPLATKMRATDAGAVTVQYQRFARARAPESLVVELHGAPAGQLALHIDRDLARSMNIQSFSPSPIAGGIDPAGVTYVFALAPGASGRIEMTAKPQQPGIARGTIAVNDRRQTITQIVWP